VAGTEFAQIGIEHFGSRGKVVDIEILLIAVEAFERLGIPDFQINLGSVDFFGGIVDRISLPEARSRNLKEVLNLKDQSGLEVPAVGSVSGATRVRTSCAPFRG
jgi:ATP phosphoribosyltransferase regulatory subunit HisZ